MAIFGWKKIAQAEVYTKAAEQKRMAAQGIGALVMPGQTPNKSVQLGTPVEESWTLRGKKH
jgi:hypothetical protein